MSRINSILFLYSAALLAAGYFFGVTVQKFRQERELFKEYRKAEELRAIINSLLNEMSLNIAEALKDADEVFDYESSVK